MPDLNEAETTKIKSEWRNGRHLTELGRQQCEEQRSDRGEMGTQKVGAEM